MMSAKLKGATFTAPTPRQMTPSTIFLSDDCYPVVRSAVEVSGLVGFSLSWGGLKLREAEVYRRGEFFLVLGTIRASVPVGHTWWGKELRETVDVYIEVAVPPGSVMYHA